MIAEIWSEKLFYFVLNWSNFFSIGHIFQESYCFILNRSIFVLTGLIFLINLLSFSNKINRRLDTCPILRHMSSMSYCFDHGATSLGDSLTDVYFFCLLWKKEKKEKVGEREGKIKKKNKRLEKLYSVVKYDHKIKYK